LHCAFSSSVSQTSPHPNRLYWAVAFRERLIHGSSLSWVPRGTPKTLFRVVSPLLLIRCNQVGSKSPFGIVLAQLVSHKSHGESTDTCLALVYKDGHLATSSCKFSPRHREQYSIPTSILAQHSTALSSISCISTLHPNTDIMPSSCKSRQAILRGVRPNSQQKTVCGICTSRCIYCDIWKLANLISTRIPLTQKYGAVASPKLHRSSRAESPTHRETYDWEASERMIDAQFQTQRVRLASIMSICTVDGADAVEGLRLAHDRCLGSVKELLYQERVLEDTIQRSTAQRSSSRPGTSQRTGQGCGNSTTNNYYYSNERRPSRVGLAL
jgi:hypothetical protein